jgi:hypothetical protein
MSIFQFTLKHLAVAGLAALAFGIAPRAAAKLEACLPADTFWVWQIADAPALRSRIAQHPIAKSLETPEFAALFTKLRAAAEKSFSQRWNETGGDKEGAPLYLAGFEEAFREIIKEGFLGEIIHAAIPADDFAAAAKESLSSSQKFFKTVLFETALDEKQIEKILGKSTPFREYKSTWSKRNYILYKEAWQHGKGLPHTHIPKDKLPPADGERVPCGNRAKTTNFDGAALHEFEMYMGDDVVVYNSGWALVNKTFVWAGNPVVLRELVTAVKKGREKHFGETSAWKKSLADAGKSDFLFVLNPVPCFEWFRKINLMGKKAKNPNLSEEEAMKNHDAQHFEYFTRAWLAFNLTQENIDGSFEFHLSEKGGFWNIFSLKQLETLIPQGTPAAASGFSVKRADFNQVAAPFLSLFSEDLDAVKKETGLDVKDAIFDNLGENFITLSKSWRAPVLDQFSLGVLYFMFAEDGGEMRFRCDMENEDVWIFDVKDTAKLESFIETLSNKFGGGKLFTEREFLGIKIREITKNIPMNVDGKQTIVNITLPFAILNDKFVISRWLRNEPPTFFQTALAEMKKPSAEAGGPALKTLVKRIPKDAVAFYYQDLEKAGNSFWKNLFNCSKVFFNTGEFDFFIDYGESAALSADLPEVPFPWQAFEFVREEKNCFTGKIMLLPKD